MNTGAAGVSDPTSVERCELVDEVAPAARAIEIPGSCIAAARLSLGPSECFRPPQDDKLERLRTLTAV